MQVFLFAAAVNGFIAVALGAFAAHGLSDLLDTYQLGIFKTGAEYQLTHALTLMLVALLCKSWPQNKYLKVSGWALIWGMFFFSFSLYALALTGIGILGAITPIGGLGFLVGWGALAFFAFSLNASPQD